MGIEQIKVVAHKMAEKDEKTVVSIKDKLKTVKQLYAGETDRIIASEMNVGTNGTVSDWKKSCEQ